MNTSLTRLLKLGAILVVVVIVLGYTYIQVENLLSGPRLTVVEPIDGSTLESSYVRVRGFVENVVLITLNDRSIVFDEKGYFKESLLLSPGYNIMELTVEDRFGRSRTKTLELVLK